MSDEMIYVTQPTMPPLEEFLPYLERIWSTKQLTNNGPLHQELELSLRGHLGVDDIVLYSNGTIALLAALRALRLEGEVLTTPFSFIATSHALRWSGLQPVFVDVEEAGFNLDPNALEAAITPKTSAILAVHCYGYPCDSAAIQNVADRHGLKVVYDAAHAFGVEDEGGSILRHGDLSTLSFHATKVFTTLEGGAVVCREPEMRQTLCDLKNFGIADQVRVVDTGINGKLNEMGAAFGLLQLKYLNQAIERRKEVDTLYRQLLSDIPGVTVPPLPAVRLHNYSYFPVLITREFSMSRDGLYEFMKANGVHPRRYFYPLITNQVMYQNENGAAPSKLPRATRLAEQILCLPIYPDLEARDIEAIVAVVRRAAQMSAALP
ncbi:MAG: DegT/DnrJ/EryC1/StrS family aminotransferase [Pseudomonadota bacterium]